MAAPRAALVVVAAGFVGLSLMVALFTQPWEANDEPYHARNIETLRGGDWYRIGGDDSIETHQPPLYYLALAGYAEVIRLPENATDPRSKLTLADWIENPETVFRHDVDQEGDDTFYVRRLRMPSIVLGLVTVLLAAATAGLVTSDRWTPVVAAATVAFVPKFVFISGVVNNDNLANTLGALAIFLAVAIAVRRWPARDVWLCVALGVTTGAMALAKASTLFLVPGVAFALFLAFRREPRQLARLAAVTGGTAVAVSVWWFVVATAWYGDPVASAAARDHFADVAPHLVVGSGSAERLFVELPKAVWRNFWYSSGWNQLRWGGWVYVPFWGLLAAGLVGLTRRVDNHTPRGAEPVLAVLALGGPAAVFVLAVQTNSSEARVAFVSLIAVGVLYALGVQRLGVPVWARFVLPALGLAGTVVALRDDVFALYRA